MTAWATFRVRFFSIEIGLKSENEKNQDFQRKKKKKHKIENSNFVFHYMNTALNSISYRPI